MQLTSGGYPHDRALMASRALLGRQVVCCGDDWMGRVEDNADSDEPSSGWRSRGGGSGMSSSLLERTKKMNELIIHV